MNKQLCLPKGLKTPLVLIVSFFSRAACQGQTTGGMVVAWGDNSLGQTNVPSSATNVTAIAAGFAHNLALRSDGTLVS
jgi:alpha-tubulin suppressor-like RCC1 family protein